MGETLVRTLTKRSEFLRLQQGRKFVRPTMVVQMAPRKDERPDESYARIGFTATKTLGNAVVRNRVKRRLRAAVRQIFPLNARAGCDYVLIGRQKAFACAFSELLQDLQFALDRLHR